MGVGRSPRWDKSGGEGGRALGHTVVARRMRTDVGRGVRVHDMLQGTSPGLCSLPANLHLSGRLLETFPERQASSNWEPYDVEELRGKTMGIIG